jgi:tetratricopeptide (TPR) repeat protein
VAISANFQPFRKATKGKTKQQFKIHSHFADSDAIDELNIVCAQLAKSGCHDESEVMFNKMNNLGILYKDQGQFRAAEEMYIRALAGKEELFGHNDEPTLDSVHCLGLLYATEGRLGEAATLWERHLQ